MVNREVLNQHWEVVLRETCLALALCLSASYRGALQKVFETFSWYVVFRGCRKRPCSPLLLEQFSFKLAFLGQSSYCALWNLQFLSSFWHKYVWEPLAEFEVGTAPATLPHVLFFLHNFFVMVTVAKSTPIVICQFDSPLRRTVFRGRICHLGSSCLASWHFYILNESIFCCNRDIHIPSHRAKSRSLFPVPFLSHLFLSFERDNLQLR